MTYRLSNSNSSYSSTMYPNSTISVPTTSSMSTSVNYYGTKEFRLIIAGGRDFLNIDYLTKEVDRLLVNKIKAGYQIVDVCGLAKGADSTGRIYALKRGFKVVEFEPDWNRYGKSAGYRRNVEMADYALQTEGGLVAFWDGSSKGTKHMIDIAEDKGLPYRIIRY